MKNITRFTYEYTSFQGYRVTICRRQKHFTRYFSDKQYGGEKEAYQAALATRERVLEALKQFPEDPEKAFDMCRADVPVSRYPRGLHPRRNFIPRASSGEEKKG